MDPERLVKLVLELRGDSELSEGGPITGEEVWKVQRAAYERAAAYELADRKRREELMDRFGNDDE